MKIIPFSAAAILLAQASAAQVYIDDSVFIPGEATIHSNEEVRLSDVATVYNNGMLQSHEQVLVAGGNYIRMGNSGRVITTIPSWQVSPLGIGFNSNNRLLLLQTSGQAQAYKIGLTEPVYENPETGSNAIPSGIAGRTWMIEPLSAPGTTDITLGWNSTEEINLNRDSATIATWEHGNSTRWQRNGHAPANNTGSSPSYERGISMNMNAGQIYYLHISDTTTPTGVKNISTAKAESFFSVFPNPANSVVSYSFSAEEGSYQLLLHDMTGRLLGSHMHTTQTNTQITGSIDVRHLPAAVYLISLRTGNKTETKRLLIGHQ